MNSLAHLVLVVFSPPYSRHVLSSLLSSYSVSLSIKFIYLALYISSPLSSISRSQVDHGHRNVSLCRAAFSSRQLVIIIIILT